jgi:hypothetical protein
VAVQASVEQQPMVNLFLFGGCSKIGSSIGSDRMEKSVDQVIGKRQNVFKHSLVCTSQSFIVPSALPLTKLVP